ncbi:hypothetical protein L838_1027 [Mycobacterium avium MAV_120709_2344]|nr:hypothetical protein L838_1027 [Mycobacterium avium MAV_120709_2344]
MSVPRSCTTELLGGGFGDVEAHHRSAERHRAARDADYLAAEQDQ